MKLYCEQILCQPWPISILFFYFFFVLKMYCVIENSWDEKLCPVLSSNGHTTDFFAMTIQPFFIHC